MARLEFFGVRGSHPTPMVDNLKFGGNTSCVVLYSDADADGKFPVILDLGTGLVKFAASQPQDGSFRGTALLTHLHFDHIQGLPFFSPIDRKGARLLIYGPSEDGMPLEACLNTLIGSPYFPVVLADLSGDISIGEIGGSGTTLDQPGSPKVVPALVDHTNSTYGFRIEIDEKIIVYVPDHQAPLVGEAVKDSVRDLCAGADILIHDAQYTLDEFKAKSHWGHSTYEYALAVARSANVKSLAFFHHDPVRSDSDLAEIERRYQRDFGDASFSVFAAREGLRVKI